MVLIGDFVALLAYGLSTLTSIWPSDKAAHPGCLR